MTNARLARVVLAGGLAAMAAANPGAQSGPQPPDDRPRFGTSTAAVVVDVIVRDKKGNPVTDLTRDDFQVFENGTAQALIDFERVMPGPDSTAPSPASPVAEAAPVPAGASAAETPKALNGQRVTAIVFDWLSDQARYEAWKAASTLLDQMTPDDFVAVYVIDQALRRIVPYTKDTASLKSAFDIAVSRPSSIPTVARNSNMDRLVNQRDLPGTASAEYAAGANTLNSVSTDNRGPDAALAAMLERELNWEQLMNRQQQGLAVANALTGLVEQLGSMPGRKTVVLFSEGLVIPERYKTNYDAMEDRANRHNVSFYTIDAAGLRVFSPSRATYEQMGEAGEQNVARGIADDPTGRRTELMWRDPTFGLRPLAERTGGIYIGDTNDLANGFAKVNFDRRFHYLLAYSSSNPALDGSFRKIEVKVRRRDVRLKARSGYVASPSIERAERRDYETPALAALSQKPQPSAFPFLPRALSTPMSGHPGMTSLVAAIDTSVATFNRDTAAGTYDGEITVVARVAGQDGEPLVTQSQLYELRGELGKMERASRGSLLFFRTPDIPPGTHIVEWVVRDGVSGRASVLRSPVSVPPPDVRPVVGDLVLVDHVERVSKKDLATAGHPLVWNNTILYPSMGLPLSKATRKELTFFLPMLVASGTRPATTVELLHGGSVWGTVAVPDVKAEKDSLRQVGTLAIDKLPPGVYELRATVTAGDRKVARSASFTVVL